MNNNLINKGKTYAMFLSLILLATLLGFVFLFSGFGSEKEFEYKISENKTVIIKTMREFDIIFLKKIKIEKKYRLIEARIKNNNTDFCYYFKKYEQYFLLQKYKHSVKTFKYPQKTIIQFNEGSETFNLIFNITPEYSLIISDMASKHPTILTPIKGD